jgi:glutathione S-transferase
LRHQGRALPGRPHHTPQGSDAFTAVSPLRRIPVFIDDQVTLADSTAIGEYLDERYPAPPVFPKTPAARHRARWLEEFADTRMGDVFIWRIFNVAIIRPGVWKIPRDDLHPDIGVFWQQGFQSRP